ncbi:hypothetical protein QQX98_010761 [Neonectria punicea]|uniref:Uncharacterized protein n=1 Tax=Neonectria punicea TaxID=979145 RepID=A0ABR1GNL1_9HYPO
MGEEVQAAGKAITVGVDPVLGSDPHAFRYERQAAGTKPRYYNPYDQTSHASTASATWESYPGKVGGRPRPQPPVMEAPPGSSRPGKPGPMVPEAPNMPRPARVKPGPQRAPVPDNWMAALSGTSASNHSNRPLAKSGIVEVVPTMVWQPSPDHVRIPYAFVPVDTPRDPPASLVTRGQAAESGHPGSGPEAIRKPKPARTAGTPRQPLASSGTPMCSGAIPDGIPHSPASSGTLEVPAPRIRFGGSVKHPRSRMVARR